MDNSETYIQMRRQAIPDLGIGVPAKFGIDTVESLSVEPEWVTDMIFVDIKGDFYIDDRQNGYAQASFQLERQSQLQDMVEDNDYWEIRRYPVSGRLDNEFPYELIIYSDSVETIRCATMEQLWLAFIMHELYGKRWNGTAWVS